MNARRGGGGRAAIQAPARCRPGRWTRTAAGRTHRLKAGLCRDLTLWLV